MQHQPNRPVSGHVRLREGKDAATWYAKWRGPVRLPDGSIVTKQAEQKIGPAWRGKGRTPAGHFTKAKAKEWLDAKLTDLRRGEGIPTAGDGATFADAAAEWYLHGCNVTEWKPTTRRDYRSALNVHLGVELDKKTYALVASRPPFGDMPLEQMTMQTFERWRTGEMADGRLPHRTAIKVTAIAHGIYERARRTHGITTNPIKDVEKLKDRYTPEDYDWYEPEEVAALERAAASERDAAIYRTAAFGGMRMGELLALRVRDVDFEADSIRVMGNVDAIEGVGTTKGGHGRTVPMVPAVAQTLARQLQREHFTGPDDFIFPNETGRHMNGSALRRRFKAAQTTAKLRPIKFHELRHTFGSLAVREVGGFDVQNYMGHKDMRTTARYLHYRRRSGEAQKLAGAFRVEEPETVETVAEEVAPGA